ncbi:tRNA (guanosine(37)-N1)-methyltransferase TrmD [Aciditerrimonas ferrireducens]|uniref:tRNA (guanosine(37)-N1)-methyltransferase TrmD n=1 Tax=Aciditerrimonas ferrireducens TaxID=667306 RepID=UPI002005954C|nr:tRNA (guanosine(37)-N1)-methyltransferase TrmD [Aciditerrimonas ferrireducens]MCK4177938.1 tRNA (guanosine(37)-N1)-methyltransferase TrmD [Aciditerrimonas ferrireducens]
MASCPPAPAPASSPGPWRIEVLTIFPQLVQGYASIALLARAQAAGVLDLRVHDLRHGADDPRRSVDDAPFGGGAGMVLAPEPIARVVETVQPRRPLILLSPAGRRLDQGLVEELAHLGLPDAPGFSLLCGRYEGVDQRVVEALVDQELSIGDYVLAGGELAALVVLEAVARLLPGVLGNEASPLEESFSRGLLEYPQYTRPATWRGRAVPPVLLSGDHGRVARWRAAMALWRTQQRRPDLLAARGGLTPAEQALLDELPKLTGAEPPPPSGAGSSGESDPGEGSGGVPLG